VRDALRRRIADAFVTGATLRRNTLQSAEVEALESAGRLTWQVGLGGRGHIVHIANLSHFENDEGDLRHLLAAYLADAAVLEQAKKDARVIGRFLAGAGKQCSDEALLEAASRIPSASFHTLLDQIHGRTAGSTRRNYKSYLRRLLRFAAAQGVVPIVWPSTQIFDGWQAVAEEMPPSSKARTLVLAAREHFIERLGPDGADPRVLTAEQVQAVYRGLRAAGKFYEARRAQEALSRLGAVGIGPRAARVERPYLEWPEKVHGPALDTSAGLVALLQAHGYPDSLIDAIQYHADSCLMSDKDLALKYEHPVKRIRRQISEPTFGAHALRIRLLLWFARFRVGISPADTTPDVLFSDETMRSVIAHFEEEWTVRADRGEVTAAATGDYAQTLHLFGMVAETLRARAVHQRLRLQKSRVVDQESVLQLGRDEANYSDARDYAFAQATAARNHREH
jgi:hypothetical protein